MYVQGLFDLRKKAQSHFGPRALYRATQRHDPPEVSEHGNVKFLLYDSFVFGFGIMEPPLTSLAFFLVAPGEVTTRSVLGKKLVFIENTEQDVENAFRVVDEYCRLRLPDKFLQVYDAL